MNGPRGYADRRPAHATAASPSSAQEPRCTTITAAGSIGGAVLGGLFRGVFPDLVLMPMLAVILLVSAVELARHD
ncbi:hypothetical protein ACFT38_07480 [Streptomyces sp. NPDC056975]|uniref:hypothetical protein n=1 Tax=Streptomyces sp. NPDC056975 TaxID=3345985 RepID=UPI00363B6354